MCTALEKDRQCLDIFFFGDFYYRGRKYATFSSTVVKGLRKITRNDLFRSKQHWIGSVPSLNNITGSETTR